MSDLTSVVRKVTNDLNATFKEAKGGVAKTGDDELLSDVRMLVPTPSYLLNKLLGGGVSVGRVLEIFGDESCIAGESFILFQVRDVKTGHRVNSKGGTVRRLYERFHNTTTDEEPKQGRHLQKNTDVKFFVPSVGVDGRIVSNEVADVVHCGTQECFRVLTKSGESIVSTLEHKYMTVDGFKELSDLKIGDSVFVHNNTRVVGQKSRVCRPEVFVKYHPVFPVKVVTDYNTGFDYIHYRGQKSRLVYEAFLNGMEYDAYVEFLNTKSKEEINALITIPICIHVHHEDEDFTNNNIENLKLIDPSEHGRIHISTRLRNLSFIPVLSEIVSIEPVGEKDTYDIKCFYPNNNYVADGVVVHNCGKTTIGQIIMCGFQQYPGVSAMIDSEFTWDKRHAIDHLGHDHDRHIHLEVDSLEQGVDVADSTMTKLRMPGSGIPPTMPICLVWDTISNSALEAEVEDDEYKEGAMSKPRKLRQLMRKWSKKLPLMSCSLVFLSQTYTGPQQGGMSFGAPKKRTSGGAAIKFWASQRIKVWRGDKLNYPYSNAGVVLCLETVKDKQHAPWKTVELPLLFERGIHPGYECINFLLDNDKKNRWVFMDRKRVYVRDYPAEGENLSFGYNDMDRAIEDNEGLIQYLRACVDDVWERKYGH
jgi:recombination protein RecA